MNKVVLTLLLFIFSLSAGIWVFTQVESEDLTDLGKPYIAVKESAETYPNSIEISSVDSSTKEKNVDGEDESRDLIVLNEAGTIKLIADNADTNVIRVKKTIGNNSDSLKEIDSVDDYETVNDDSTENREKCENLKVISEIETPVILTDNKSINKKETEEITDSGVDSMGINTVDECISYHGEKSSVDESYCSVSTASLNHIPVIHMPEKSWPDSNRIRRELTLEVAKKHPSGNFIQRKIVNNAWNIGEHLTFSINYGFIPAGTATMTVVGIEEVNGGTCYKIGTTATSNKFISTFYEVRDTVRSFIDVKGIFSRRIEKILREGNYKSDRYVDFYHDRLIALNTREKYALTEIPLYAQDILSSLYLLRTFDLEVGKDETIITYADGKVYPLRIIVHKIENVKVPAGEFKCFKVEPVLKSEGIFRQKGKLMVWLTDDECKLPVKMTSKVLIGDIGSNLEKYTLGEIE